MTATADMVSVIVATRNREPVLRAHSQALLAQDAEHYELIYVDDGSTDGTPQVLGELAAAHPERMRTAAGPGQGPGVARNVGAGMARGSYLLFTDDDVLVPPDWISGMLALQAQYGCEAVSGGFVPASMATKVEQYLHYRMRLLFGDASKRVKAAPMMSFLVRRDSFERVGGFANEPLLALEDWDLCWRLSEAGAVIQYDPRVRVTHQYQSEWEPALARLRETARTSVRLFRKHHRSMARFLLKATIKWAASPLWSLMYYPVTLYGLSLKAEWGFYRECLRELRKNGK